MEKYSLLTKLVRSTQRTFYAKLITQCRKPGGVGHGPKRFMGKKMKTAHLHLTFALFTSLVTP